jgi:hypothetical protein
MEEKKLLRKLGEETLFSAKGHFKACDVRRNLVTITIWLCVVMSILDIMNFVSNDVAFDAIGLFGAIALLIWEQGEGVNYRSKHKVVAEQYLSLHKEIREYYYLENLESKKIKLLSEKVRVVDNADKPDIPWVARRLAKFAIEKNNPETDNWYEKKKK